MDILKGCERTFTTLSGVCYHLKAYHRAELSEEALYSDESGSEDEGGSLKEGEESENWSDRVYLKDLLQKTGRLFCPKTVSL